MAGHINGRTFRGSSARGDTKLFPFFFFFSIGASLSGGRSLVRRCKENCCGDRKEARPVDINRGRGPVADATDELTPVDIKISLLFLTASSRTSPSFFSFLFFFLLVRRLPRRHAVLLFHAIIASASRASLSSPPHHRIPSRLVFTGAFSFRASRNYTRTNAKSLQAHGR